MAAQLAALKVSEMVGSSVGQSADPKVALLVGKKAAKSVVLSDLPMVSPWADQLAVRTAALWDFCSAPYWVVQSVPYSAVHSAVLSVAPWDVHSAAVHRSKWGIANRLDISIRGINIKKAPPPFKRSPGRPILNSMKNFKTPYEFEGGAFL